MFLKTRPKITIICALLLALNAVAIFAQKKDSPQVTLTKCWSLDVDAKAGGSIVTDGRQIYVGSAGAKIDAVSLAGNKLWSAELGGEINSNLAAGDTGLLVATAAVSDGNTSGNTLRSISKETGVTNWSVKLPVAAEHFLRARGGEIVVVSKNGIVQLLNAKDGSVKWRREIAEGFSSRPAFSNEKVVVSTTTRQVFAVSLSSGEIETIRKPENAVSSLGHFDNGGLIVGDERGGVSYFSSIGEKADWKFRSGGSVSAIFAVNGSVLFTSHDNFAYLLSSSSGASKWKRRLSGRVTRIATFENKFAIVSSIDDHSVVVVDLSNGKTIGQIPLADDETAVNDPVAGSGSIFVLSDRAVYGYSFAECAK